MTCICCAENKLRLTSASYMPQSIWAFYSPLGVSIKKILQTAGYQFTVYRSGKRNVFKQACAVHLVFTESHPKVQFQTRILYLCMQFCMLVMSIIHIWFSALSSKYKMSKIIDL